MTLVKRFPTMRPHRVKPCIREERAQTVRRAVAALPKELRLPLILAEYEEKSHAEIGEILGCSAKAVEVRIYRARKESRVSLGKLLETT